MISILDSGHFIAKFNVTREMKTMLIHGQNMFNYFDKAKRKIR